MVTTDFGSGETSASHVICYTVVLGVSGLARGFSSIALCLLQLLPPGQCTSNLEHPIYTQGWRVTPRTDPESALFSSPPLPPSLPSLVWTMAVTS